MRPMTSYRYADLTREWRLSADAWGPEEFVLSGQRSWPDNWNWWGEHAERLVCSLTET